MKYVRVRALTYSLYAAIPDRKYLNRGIVFHFLSWFPLNMEETEMQKVRRYIRGALLTAALAVPVALVAAPVPQEAQVQVRVYDSEHKDYHNWDDHENAAWIRFQDENHRKHHEFTKADKKEQAEYWNWRHSHPD
jgi:hypothetical protein